LGYVPLRYAEPGTSILIEIRAEPSGFIGEAAVYKRKKA